jgi:hypothetical protein
MLTVVGLVWDFLKSYWKLILIALVIGAILWAVHYVYASIEQIGYTKGEAAGEAVKQKIIDQMTDQQNAQNLANNKKISQLESQSQVDAKAINDLQLQVQQKRTSVITKYVQANPSASKQCGFDQGAVQTINQLIQVDPSIVQ